jgi:hypothetical protein
MTTVYRQKSVQQVRNSNDIGLFKLKGDSLNNLARFRDTAGKTVIGEGCATALLSARRDTRRSNIALTSVAGALLNPGAPGQSSGTIALDLTAKYQLIAVFPLRIHESHGDLSRALPTMAESCGPLELGRGGTVLHVESRTIVPLLWGGAGKLGISEEVIRRT